MTSLYKKLFIKLVIICILIFSLFIDKGSIMSFFKHSSFYQKISNYVVSVDTVRDDLHLLSNECTREHGVLDRIKNNGQAVILIEDLNEQWIIQKDDLPKNSKVHMWFNIEQCIYTIKIESIDYEKTIKEMNESKKLINQLHEYNQDNR